MASIFCAFISKIYVNNFVCDKKKLIKGFGIKKVLPIFAVPKNGFLEL